jgi:hypothetical protein
MSKARDLANAGTALTTVSATELGYLDGVTSAVQTQIDAREATLPSQTGNSGKYLTTNGTAKSWGTVSQYALPTQTGNSGKYLTTNGTAESWGTVTTPVTWNQKVSNNQTGEFLSITSNGSTIYVAVGQSGVLYSSTNSGSTWTSRTSQFGTSSIYSVAFGNGIFVAVGESGKISTSTDGITWTARTANVSTNNLWDVKYLNGNFVAVGLGAGGGTGGVTTSTDGITWTKRTTPASTSSELLSVTYGNGYYVAVGSFNTTAGIYSTNLSTWTGLPTSLAARQVYIDYQNSKFMTWAEANTTGYTTGNNPTSAWTSNSGMPYFTLVTNPGGGMVSVYDNKYYYVSAQSAVGTNNISVVSTAFTLYYSFDTIYSSIPTPSRQTSSTSLLNAGSIYVNPTGGIVIGCNGNRLYTSF